MIAYILKGAGTVNGEPVDARTLVRSDGFEFGASEDSQLILVYPTRTSEVD